MKHETETQLIITLRHNIDIVSDVQLALDEVVALCNLTTDGEIRQLKSSTELLDLLRSIDTPGQTVRLLTHFLRKDGVVAFAVAGVTLGHVVKVLRCCAFGQDIFFVSPEPTDINDALCRKLSRAFKLPNKRNALCGITLGSVLDYTTRMVFNRDKGTSVSVALDALIDYLLNEQIPANGMLPVLKEAIATKKTSLYLTHELHLYKGKFFPRLVRSLMNRFATSPDAVIADPFLGSGTVLLEAALLGHRSIGVDVDPTSILISSQKLAPAHIDPALMQDVCLGIYEATRGEHASLFSASRFSLKNWKNFAVVAPEPMRSRLIKRGNEEGYDLIGEVENDSAIALCLISQLPPEIQPLLRVCLSHALTKKLRLRFVGIGNGRFTFDVAKIRVLDLFVKKAFHLVAITEVFRWLKRNGMAFPTPEVIRGSAKDFRSLLHGQQVDMVLTSPPYIPASSGREHYARARAVPLVFTGAVTVEELDHLDEQFVGEMSAQHDSSHLEETMPPTIRRTLDFLRNNEQRRPKYLPTLNYYVDLQRVLANVRDSLTESGKALFVVATSHTFYIHRTRQILHTTDAVNAIAELAEKVGIHVSDVIDVPLKKSGGLNARPRSTDKYSESVLIFSRS